MVKHSLAANGGEKEQETNTNVVSSVAVYRQFCCTIISMHMCWSEQNIVAIIWTLIQRKEERVKRENSLVNAFCVPLLQHAHSEFRLIVWFCLERFNSHSFAFDTAETTIHMRTQQNLAKFVQLNTTILHLIGMPLSTLRQIDFDYRIRSLL